MKLAIKVPDSVSEIIQSFPLIHAINKLMVKRWEDTEIDDFEIHFLCNKKSLDVLNLLPVKAYYHELEDGDSTSIFSMHRAIKNAKIDHVDFFLSTTKSFVDASIGKNLNAQIRAGFAINKNKMFINKSCPYLEGQHQSHIFYNLIATFDSQVPSEIPKVGSRDLEAIYDDYSENPYLAINLPLNNLDEIDSQWIDFFDLFNEKTFVICSDKVDHEIHDLTLAPIIKKFNPKNTYKILNPEDRINFAKMVSFSKGFVSFDSDLIYVAAYCGANCFWLNESNTQGDKFPEYFYAEVKRYNFQDPTFKSDKGQYNLSPIFDELYQLVCPQIATETETDSDA